MQRRAQCVAFKPATWRRVAEDSGLEVDALDGAPGVESAHFGGPDTPYRRKFELIYDRGGATATGTIRGSDFTLEGRRLALPFTVTGRVQGRKMTGSLLALGIERRFTGVRRGNH